MNYGSLNLETAKIILRQYVSLFKSPTFGAANKYLSRDIGFPTMWYVRPARHTRSLIRAIARRLNILSVKLLNKQYLEFLNLKGGCTGSSESTLV